MEKEKLQHYSIRKLSVGAASVLIGLSFVGMHDSSLVKADTVNDTQAQQTKQVQQQKNEEQSHVPVVVAKTQNDQQVVQDQNKDSQAQNGNKQSAVVNKVAQSTSTTQTTDKTTNVETNEQLSQKNTQTDSANQKATVAQAQQSGNSKLSKNDVTIKSIQSSVANTDFKKDTSTNSLTIKPIKSRVNDIRTLLLAQKSVETNPVKKSNLELNKVGNTQGEHSALSNTTRLSNLQDPIHFGLKGSFKVDGTALNSIGAQIKLADITESNNLNSNLNFRDLQPDWAWIDNDENIGTFSLQQNDPHHMSLLLKMTKNKDFVGDVDINISTADSFSLNYDVPASQYKGVSDSNPAVSTINTGNHSYKIVMPFNSANYHEYEYQDSKVSTWQNGDTAAAETAYLTFVDDNLNKHDLVQELEQSQGASMSAKLQNLKRVVQISGSNISENMDDYNPIQWDNRILVIDANGRLTNDSISVDINSGVKKQLLANNLTPQEIYDQTAPDTYGFSKQIDGSWLICCNLSPSNSQMANNLESRIRDRSIYANIIDPQNADKIVQNTLNFYKGALQNTPLEKTIGVFLEDGRQTDFTVKDLTPGDNRHNQATGFVGESTSNADGSIARYVNVQTVDDDNDQLIIGKPQIYRGKSGTSVLIKYTVPQNYELVPDQSIPVQYTLQDTNSPIVIHLRHKRQSVVTSKVVAETIHYKYEDGSKAADDYNAKHVVLDRTGYKDLVTGKTVYDGDWSTGQFAEVAFPKINGYTATVDGAAQARLATVNVDGNTSDIDKTVIYKANDQTIIVNYIDDTANKTINTDKRVGKSNTSSNYSTRDAISNYQKQGYDLVSDDTNGSNLIYDKDDQHDQVYAVHFKHHISTVTDPKLLTATFDRIVTEKLPDGKDKQITQHYVITRTGTQDQVTKKYNFSNWNTADVHEDQGDVLDGYTAEIDSANIDGIALVDDSGVPTIKAEKFTNENNNSTTPVNVEERVEIGYLPNDQKATITFIDDDAQKDKQVLQTQNLVGKSNTKSDYDTGAAIEEYLNQGYDLVSDDTQGNPITFDTHDKVDQVFTVHLKHHISDVTDPRVLTATFDRVVTETLPDGKDKQITQHYVITRTGKQDQVTKKYAWSDWTTAQVHEDKGDTFEGYTPHLSGNNLDSFISLVNGTPIAKAEVFTNENGKLLPKNISEKVDITYTANPQEAAIVFYDDTADTPLQKNTVRGHYGEAIEFTPKVSDVITEYTKKGYVLVSNEFDNQKYAADDKQNVFVVHLKHGTMDVTRSKDVTETIHYVYDNNSKAHDDYVTTKKFENHGVKDLVTGETKWDTNWTPENDQFAQVNSPEIPGYTADKENIPAQTVNADSKNLEYTVTYTQTPAPTPYEPSDPVQPAQPTQPDVQPSTPVVPDQPVDQDDSNKSESTPTKKVVKVKKNKIVSDSLVNNSVSDKQDSYLPSDYGNYVAKDESTDVQSPKVVARGSLPKTTEVKSNAKELPTTGAKDEDQLSYVGLALAGLVGMFGYSIKKRKD